MKSNQKRKAIDWLQSLDSDGIKDTIIEELQKPERSTGIWIESNYAAVEVAGELMLTGFVCSNCQGVTYFRVDNDKIVGAQYCPVCGAKMEDS